MGESIANIISEVSFLYQYAKIYENFLLALLIIKKVGNISNAVKTSFYDTKSF